MNPNINVYEITISTHDAAFPLITMNYLMITGVSVISWKNLAHQN